MYSIFAVKYDSHDQRQYNWGFSRMWDENTHHVKNINDDQSKHEFWGCIT